MVFVFLVFSSKDLGVEFFYIRELVPFIKDFEELAAHAGRGIEVFVDFDRPEQAVELKSEAFVLVNVWDGHNAVDLSVLVFCVVGSHVGFWVKQSQASANVSGK